MPQVPPFAPGSFELSSPSPSTSLPTHSSTGMAGLLASRVRRFCSYLNRELSAVSSHLRRTRNYSLLPLRNAISHSTHEPPSWRLILQAVTYVLGHHTLPTIHFPSPSHQTSKFPPNPSNSSTSPRLIRMISTKVLYLNSNQILCYHFYVYAEPRTVSPPPHPSAPGFPALPPLPLFTTHSALLTMFHVFTLLRTLLYSAKS